MRSDEAWRVGHRAAASALTVAGIGPVVVAVIVGVTSPNPDTEKILFRTAKAWLLGWTGLAVVQASQAARATNI